MNKCAHRACTCSELAVAERAGVAFCSDTCAGNTASTLADAICSCGHADCTGRDTRPRTEQFALPSRE